ncbi:unnamed protein product [Malus baccata var. baccata]
MYRRRFMPESQIGQLAASNHLISFESLMHINYDMKNLEKPMLPVLGDLVKSGIRVAGWTQVYSDALSYATIRGAGHEAPISQPERLLLLFTSFLRGKPLPKALTKY